MKYRLYKDIMNHQQRRDAFNRLATDTFKLSFESWYQSGYWSERNLPYVLFDGDRAVSGISVNRMDILWEGKTQRMIQLGTVMTDRDHRNQGLSRILMAEVMKDWQDKCEAIFLFANRNVLDFYPKFGFQRYSQYQYSMPVQNLVPDRRKLDLKCDEDLAVLKSCYEKGNPFSRIQEVNDFGLLMFYCLAPMKDMVYYSRSSDMAVIAEQEQEVLHCYGLFGSGTGGLDAAVRAVAGPGTKRVVFHFTPAADYNYCLDEIGTDTDTLFVLGRGMTMFAEHRLLFPELSHT